MKPGTMVRFFAPALVAGGIALAQTGGSLRGTVRDASVAVLPGVTVTATSDALMGSQTAVTDARGRYRITNLPPGDYILTFDLPAFATFQRKGIVLRARANFQVDATLEVRGVEEAVTVTAETPMLEIAQPSNALNVEGEFQRHMPLRARRNWSDFLELTPGIVARPIDDGSGRMIYFGHGAEHFQNVVQLEGMAVQNYNDAQPAYVGMGADMIKDIQLKSGGVEASEPLGTGMVINVITKSGGNDFRGSVGYALQPMGWNDDNTPTEGNFIGTTTKRKVSQLDVSFGGPIRRDRVWFFASYRYANLETGISRSAEQMEILQAFDPNFEPFNSTSLSHQPYAKLSAKIKANHGLNVYYQSDRLRRTRDWDYYYEPISLDYTGGSLFGAKLTSVWRSNTTSQITFSYNNKGRSDKDNLEDLPGSGPQIQIFRDTEEWGGRLWGSGLLLAGGNLFSLDLGPSSITLIRADVTHHVADWGGSHELQTGVYAAPRLHHDRETHHMNDGFVLEGRHLVDKNDPGSGTIPFIRWFYDPPVVPSLAARDRDIGIYFQDAWRPTPRLTLNLGIRADWANRYDGLHDITRMSNSLALGPRFGFSYLITEDARNVLRGSVVRVHEQVGGRDSATAVRPGSFASTLTVYDYDRDGVFETEFFTPGATATLAAHQFDPDLHQPWVDEAIVGFRKQFPKQLVLDVAWIHRTFRNRYTAIDVNGFYPEGPFQPFGGFGRIDPDRAQVWQRTNATWDRLVFDALELTVTQRLPGKLQFMAGLTRQWQHISGDWNPTDPARFIQPDAFPNNKLIWSTRGGGSNSFSYSTTYGPMWRKYSVRLGGVWFAPHGIVVAASYTQLAGPWSGPLLEKLDKNDPDVLQFGPAKVVSETGSVQSNPLATIYRFVGPTRGDGQVKKSDVMRIGLKVAKTIALGGTRELELGASIFNLPNLSGHHQYKYVGANQTWSPHFLKEQNRQSPRALQLTFVFRY
jgi:hypothetical protein